MPSEAPLYRRCPSARLAIALAALVLAGCASTTRPVLYPNAHYQAVGRPAAERAVDGCMQLAQEAGPGVGGDAAASTVRGAAIGGTTGAIWGSFSGNAGRGLAAGAAAGAATGLIGSALAPSRPPSGYEPFVQRCLSDQGFEVVGWR